MDLHKIDWENMPWEPVREGIVRKSFSGSGATLALHKLMPKHEPKPHKHTYEQLVYILAGHIRFHVGDKSVVLGPGGLLQIPPDVMHWGEVVGDEPVLFSRPCARNMRRRHDRAGFLSPGDAHSDRLRNIEASHQTRDTLIPTILQPIS
jgi:quercetin dioxygenase-like cupin family protein